jgi:hypothetical protein
MYPDPSVQAAVSGPDTEREQSRTNSILTSYRQRSASYRQTQIPRLLLYRCPGGQTGTTTRGGGR